MCTVTYLPLKNGDFILTSNRDETPLRKTISPKKYLENDVELTYPKDELAGGTWIGTSNHNRLVCLLNGGFKNHVRNTHYTLSRGVIVKNILSVDNPVNYINNFNFNAIEPFTLILLDWNLSNLEAYELVWDGKTKHFQKLEKKPRIWSSSTLYTQEMKEQRNIWFSDWLANQQTFLQSEILKLHRQEIKDSIDFSFKMKRSKVETVSISSIKKNGKKVSFLYQDFISNKITIVST